jgi:DNA-binding transcriptional LysR family regulator
MQADGNPASEISLPGESREIAAAEPPELNLRKFDLNLLVGLKALLKYRNVSHAAEHLGLSQSAMSDELRRLRQMFEDELLVRTGRGYELTPLAIGLEAHLGDVLRAIQLMVVTRPTFDPSTTSRHFAIAMSDYTMLLLFAPLLRRFKEEAPAATLGFHPLYGDFRTMVKHDPIDLLLAPAGELIGLRSVDLFQDGWVCVVDEKHPRVQDTLDLEVFLELPHLVVVRDGNYLPEVGVPRRVEAVTESWAVAPFLLQGSPLIAVLQQRLVHRLQATVQLKLFAPPIPVSDIVLRMYWNPVVDADPANEWLRGVVLSVAKSL